MGVTVFCILGPKVISQKLYLNTTRANDINIIVTGVVEQQGTMHSHIRCLGFTWNLLLQHLCDAVVITAGQNTNSKTSHLSCDK